MGVTLDDVRDARRIPLWKILAGIAGGLALLAGLAALYVRSAIDRRWEQIETKARALIAEAKARDARRPALFGDTLPGNAWDDYRTAMALLKGLRSMEFKEVLEKASDDPGAARMAVALHRETLELLLRGARRAEVSPMDLELGFKGVPGLLGPTRLVQMACCAARFDAEDGRPGQAVDLLLAAAQFSRDQFDGTVAISGMIGGGLLKEVFDDLQVGVADGRWPPEALLRIERALGILDSAFPRYGDLIRNETVWLGAELLRDSDGWDSWFWGEAWRYGFSARLVLAECFEYTDRRGKEVEQARSWQAFRDLANARSGLATSHPNPSIRLQGKTEVPFLLAGRILWDRRAQLQLLRLAARYRATGEVLDLEDPFGGRLRTSLKDGRLTAWSVGPDGYYVDEPGPLRIEIDNPLK